MLELGLLTQIEQHLNEVIPFSAKRRESPKFLEYREEMMNKEFFKVNWQIVFEKDAPIPLSSEIKTAIISYFEKLLPDVETSHRTIKGYNGFVGSFLDVDFLLTQFLYKTELTENSKLYLLIKEYHEFLKSECRVRGYEIPEPFGVDPLIRYRKNSKKEEKRPNCPECQSNKISSSGINWVCSECSRSFRKVRRK